MNLKESEAPGKLLKIKGGGRG